MCSTGVSAVVFVVATPPLPTYFPARTIALSPPNTSLNARAPSTAASAALFGRCPPPLRTHLDPATPAEHFRTSWALSMRPPRISQRPCAVHRPLHRPLWIPPAALGGPTHIYPPPPRCITGALHPCTVVLRVTRAAQSTTRIPVSSTPPSSPPNFLFFLTTHPYGPFAQSRCISFFPAILLFYNSLPIYGLFLCVFLCGLQFSFHVSFFMYSCSLLFSSIENVSKYNLKQSLFES